MARFSGILLCSDFDGTLSCKEGIPQKNIDAIKYFCDNGGTFSVISGRGYDFFEKYADDLRLNSYIGCINGAMIYHRPTGKLIRRSFVNEDAGERLKRLLALMDNASQVDVFDETGKDTSVKLSEECALEKILQLMSVPVCKMIVRSAEAFADEDVDFVKREFCDGYHVSRSWKFGIEIQNADSNKGIAARYIAQLTGAKTLVCVGDYENDISLLQAADISYAVEGALPKLAAVAHRTTVRASEGAIAAIISDLDN